MTKEEAQSQIQKEFGTAAGARRQGNEGMVRVCVRRAAGIAVGFWLQAHRVPHSGPDAMSRLRAIVTDDALPPEIRAAAERLTTKITDQFNSPFSEDPVEDGKLIVGFFLGEEPSHPKTPPPPPH